MEDLCLQPRNESHALKKVSPEYIEKSIPLQVIGKGSFGEVVLIEGPDKERHVIKFQSYSDNSSEVSHSALIEGDILSRYRNVPQIITLEGLCVSRTGPMNAFELALVLENMDGTLRFLSYINYERKIELFPRLFIDLILGLASLEVENLHHLDIKPENVLFKAGSSGIVFKLIDFGISEITSFGIGDIIGPTVTPTYRAPELLEEGKGNGSKIDIWATGITLLEFLLGKPFLKYFRTPHLSYDQSVLQQIKTLAGSDQIIPIEKFVDLSSLPFLIRETFKYMLFLDPGKRPTSRQIAEKFGWIIPRPLSLPETRRVIDQYSPQIFQISLSPWVIVMVLEIVTRYNGKISKPPSRGFLGAYILASIYYMQDHRSFQDDIKVEAVQKSILFTLDWQIYNPLVEKKVEFLFNRLSTVASILNYLRDLPFEHFTQPLDEWFLNF